MFASVPKFFSVVEMSSGFTLKLATLKIEVVDAVKSGIHQITPIDLSHLCAPNSVLL